MSTRTIRGTFREGSPIHLSAEWPTDGGSLWQQADFLSVSLSVFDRSVSNDSTAIATPARVVSGVLTNTPGSWTLSATGPNFNDWVTNGEVSIEGGHSYDFEYGFVRTDGFGTERLVFTGRARPVRGA